MFAVSGDEGHEPGREISVTPTGLSYSKPGLCFSELYLYINQRLPPPLFNKGECLFSASQRR